MSEKISCAQRIRQGLAIRGMTQKDLCDKTGIPKSAMSQYCNGAFVPKQERTALISQALDVNEAWLMGYDVPMDRERFASSLPSNVVPLPQMDKIPLVGQIACGTPILAEENITDYIDLPAHISADYALTCKGDSMVNIGISDGDVVYIRQQKEVENGQVAAVMVGEDEATLKRFYYNDGIVQLVAENSTIPPKVYVGEAINQVHVIGLAVAYTHIIE